MGDDLADHRLTVRRSASMAEDIIYKWGELEILPSRMEKYVRQQKMNEGERERIVRARNIHLDWYHRHFAYEVLKPPADEWDPKA
jgi:hypothetical protein